MNNTEYYLNDVLYQLLDEAVELSRKTENDFEKGKLIGYYQIISTLLRQAEAFGITDKLPERVRNYNLESLFDQ